MEEATEKQNYQLQSQALSFLGINYLQQFPKLDEYKVEAADGHFIQHACHTGKIVRVKSSLHALNLRNGLLRPLCVVTNGSRHQEIPALRAHIEQRHGKKDSWNKQLYAYDKTATDFAWWDKQKNNLNFMVSVIKENSAATFVESIPFDRMMK